MGSHHRHWRNLNVLVANIVRQSNRVEGKFHFLGVQSTHVHVSMVHTKWMQTSTKPLGIINQWSRGWGDFIIGECNQQFEVCCKHSCMHLHANYWYYQELQSPFSLFFAMTEKWPSINHSTPARTRNAYVMFVYDYPDRYTRNFWV